MTPTDPEKFFNIANAWYEDYVKGIDKAQTDYKQGLISPVEMLERQLEARRKLAEHVLYLFEQIP